MKTAFEIATAVKNGKQSAEAAVKESLSAIAGKDAKTGAFLEVYAEEALSRAREIDAKAKAGKPLGKLAGVPVATKDNILLEGHEFNCASKILSGYKAVYTATVLNKLQSEDAIIIGRTNMDEFAMGSSCENSAIKPTRNPANTDYVPGGSSGGSAAAVAAGMVPIALGSDTGGSIRQPASFCGVTGLKPTYGRVSRYGLVAFASSLDQIGPFASDARDCALALSALAGHDAQDSTSATEAVPDYLSGIKGGVKGMKIGLPKECFGEGLEAETGSLVQAAAKKLQALGAELVDISLPHTKYAVAVYYILASSEASSNLARFDGMRYGPGAKDAAGLTEAFEKARGAGFGPEVKRRIMLGTYALSSGYYDAYYAKAQKVRTLIKRDFDDAFKTVDLILTPTSPTPAFKFGEKMSDPLAMYLSDIYTIPCNLAGITGMSVPCGRTAAGLPVGLQLQSRAFGEPALFKAAFALEKAGALMEADAR
jgi:aspartyl-tRNA(Asn)/glutamyl-tRNA(Gln) amidotransferase subunit A